MKRSSPNGAILLLAASLLFFAGCGNDNKTPTQTAASATPSQITVTSEEVKGLKSLALTVEKTNLNKDENTTVKVIASYDNGSFKEVTDKVEWVVTPSDAIQVSNATLTALKDGNITVQVKVGTTLSNVIDLNITWTVNGHTLPPEPDKALNDSTLLGIDVNNNGVRDDVERWIYETYKDKHPIYIDIALQAARGYKLVLETPEKAKEIRLKVDAALFCNWYYWKDAKEFNEPLLVEERIDTPVSSKYFNTKERKDTYLQYDKLLSGGIYDSPWADKMKDFCNFNTSKYEE